MMWYSRGPQKISLQVQKSIQKDSKNVLKLQGPARYISGCQIAEFDLLYRSILQYLMILT